MKDTPLTWRELDDRVLRELHTSPTGCWQRSERVRTDLGTIIIDEYEEAPFADEALSYATTALSVAEWNREAILTLDYPNPLELVLANREVDLCRRRCEAVGVA